MGMKIQDLRKSYTKGKLEDEYLPASPFLLFKSWFDDMNQKGTTIFDKLKYRISSWLIGDNLEANAMTLSTVLHDLSDDPWVVDKPDSRVVLMKDIGRDYIEFFTNYDSKKGKQLEQNPNVSVNFWWAPLQRQVIMRGVVKKSPVERSEEYFSTRPRESKIGAWASDQSNIISSREVLEVKQDNITAAFSEYHDEDIPKPPYWGGYQIYPDYIEFWQGRVGRVHDRIRYVKLANGRWQRDRLQP